MGLRRLLRFQIRGPALSRNFPMHCHVRYYDINNIDNKHERFGSQIAHEHIEESGENHRQNRIRQTAMSHGSQFLLRLRELRELTLIFDPELTDADLLVLSRGWGELERE